MSLYVAAAILAASERGILPRVHDPILAFTRSADVPGRPARGTVINHFTR
jgi:hypothetical protein